MSFLRNRGHFLTTAKDGTFSTQHMIEMRAVQIAINGYITILQ